MSEAVARVAIAGVGIAAWLLCLCVPAYMARRSVAMPDGIGRRATLLALSLLLGVTVAFHLRAIVVERKMAEASQRRSHAPGELVLHMHSGGGLPLAYDARTDRVTEVPEWVAWCLHWCAISTVLGGVLAGARWLAGRWGGERRITTR